MWTNPYANKNKSYEFVKGLELVPKDKHPSYRSEKSEFMWEWNVSKASSSIIKIGFWVTHSLPLLSGHCTTPKNVKI